MAPSSPELEPALESALARRGARAAREAGSGGLAQAGSSSTDPAGSSAGTGAARRRASAPAAPAAEQRLLWPPAEGAEPSLAEKPLVLLGRAGCEGPAAAGAPLPRTVLWDGGRRCFSFHWPGLLRGEANRRYYLEALREAAPWQEVLGPTGEAMRSTCWYVRGRCKCDYTYGCERVGMPKAASKEAFGQLMEELTERVFCLVCPHWPEEAWPNSANLNLYADDSQCVGWHADDESLFLGKEDDCLIVSLSLGERREFWLALKRAPGLDRMRPDPQSVLEVDLDDGDLLTMEGLCQKYCIHFVPGAASPGDKRPEVSAARGVRINVTWRWVREHKRKCPLHAKQPAARPSPLSPAALGGAVAAAWPADDAAQHWVHGVPVQWRRRCESCRWRSGRNCVRHRGRWLCRLCWQEQCPRVPGTGGGSAALGVGALPAPALAPAVAQAAPQGMRQGLPEASGGAGAGAPAQCSSGPEQVPPLVPELPPPPPLCAGGGLPALGAALRPFDGAAYGEEFLTLIAGVCVVQLPHVEAGCGWAWGAVLAGPAGWFPEALLGPAVRPAGPGCSARCSKQPGLPAQDQGGAGQGPGQGQDVTAGSGAGLHTHGEAMGDFDGGPFGADCLTVVRGAKLARLPHPAEGGGWAYGAVLVEPTGWFPTCFLGQWAGGPDCSSPLHTDGSVAAVPCLPAALALRPSAAAVAA